MKNKENNIQKFKTFLEEKQISCFLQVADNIPVSIGNAREKIDPTIIFKSSESFDRFMKSMRIFSFGKEYIDGNIDFYPNKDINSVLNIIKIAEKLEDQPKTLLEQIAEKTSSSKDSAEHYAISEEFYKAFLDKNIQYTCGFFPRSKPGNIIEDIDTAQINKFDLIHKELQIQKDCKHLDIGCGWGTLIKYFVKEYHTDSYGISNTKEQVESARKKIKDKDKIFYDDYLKFKNKELFDCITIVGMMEHVPKRRQKKFLQFVYQKLKPGGMVYLQCITLGEKAVIGDGTKFLQNFVFPGFFINTEEELSSRIKQANFKIIKHYDHSEHYSYTAQCWVENLLKNKEKMLKIKIKGKDTKKEYRTFLAYLSFAINAYADGRGGLQRFVLQK
ncbi:class I SAM-dependent methyltransferase [Candidatus Parcubacteria bacterium]|nr:class I SAM-dependent methyltransferase [Candidatus Parcubacteria bacterium]